MTSGDAILDATLADAGIAVVPDFLARKSIARSELTALLQNYEIPRIPVNALHDRTGGASRVLTHALRELKDAMAKADLT